MFEGQWPSVPIGFEERHQLLAAGVHPKIVQERLGHSTITVTMDLYSHVSEPIQSDATARLDEAYGQVPKEV
jgi:integrase